MWSASRRAVRAFVTEACRLARGGDQALTVTIAGASTGKKLSISLSRVGSPLLPPGRRENPGATQEGGEASCPARLRTPARRRTVSRIARRPSCARRSRRREGPLDAFMGKVMALKDIERRRCPCRPERPLLKIRSLKLPVRCRPLSTLQAASTMSYSCGTAYSWTRATGYLGVMVTVADLLSWLYQRMCASALALVRKPAPAR